MIELMELHVEIKLNQSPFRKVGNWRDELYC